MRTLVSSSYASEEVFSQLQTGSIDIQVGKSIGAGAGAQPNTSTRLSLC